MPHKPDLGARIAALAATLTPEQVAALLAVRLANMQMLQASTHPSHWRRDGVYASLVRAKLIVGLRDPIFGRGWNVALLTDLGERVLLHVAAEAMVATGRMRAFERWRDA